MKKIAGTIVLSIGLFFSGFSISHADSYPVQETVTSHNSQLTLDQVQNVVEGNSNTEIVDAQDLPIDTPVVQFSSEEDLQNFITTLDDNEMDPTVIDLSDDGSNSSTGPYQPLTSLHTATKVLKWYSPWAGTIFFNSAFVWKNIDFTYKYHYNTNGQRVFNSISNSAIKSYISGMFTADWHQTSADHSYYDSMRGVHFHINGYYLFGISYGGSTIGIRETDTWTKSYHF